MSNATLAACLFWSAFIVLIVVDPYIMDSDYAQAYYAFTVISFSAFTLNWVLADARELSVQTSVALRVCVLLFAVVAVPYYLVKYKGLKRSLLSFAKFLGLFVGSVVAVAVIWALLGQDA